MPQTTEEEPEELGRVLDYWRRYSFRLVPPRPIPVVKRAVEIEDSRMRVDLKTKGTIDKYTLEPVASVSLSIPLSYNREKGVYELIEQPNEVQADSYFYYYPNTPNPLSVAGWYNPRIDEYMRVITHVEQVDSAIDSNLLSRSKVLAYEQLATVGNAGWGNTLSLDVSDYAYLSILLGVTYPVWVRVYTDTNYPENTLVHKFVVSSNGGPPFMFPVSVDKVYIDFKGSDLGTGVFTYSIYGIK